MDHQSPLSRLRDDLTPHVGAQRRIEQRILSRIRAADMLREIREELTPSHATVTRLWNHVASRITPANVLGVFDQLRDTILRPSQETMRSFFLPHYAPARVSVRVRSTQWVAAFAIVVLGLRISPMFFLAPTTLAESTVMLFPTNGEVTLSQHGLLQPIDEDVELHDSVQIRTGEGEATIVLHDDGNIRLAPHTTVVLHDLTDRPEPSPDTTTLTLLQGRIWVQGLVPNHLRGITVGTAFGDVAVHGGSMMLSLDSSLRVAVWDRHATIIRDDSRTTLVSNERTELWQDTVPLVQEIPTKEYDGAWVQQNLQRDAVHQREIAQLQRERAAARAGILPTSRLYTVKRIAETVDVLLTIDPAVKIQKRLDQASTRLNEATALIAHGQTGAELPLQEYRDAVLDIASGSGDTATQFLVRQEVSENTAETAASLPDDALYVVKKTVLDTSADLPLALVDEEDVQETVLSDTIDSLQIAAVEGDTLKVKEGYDALVLQLETGSLIDPVTQKEVYSQLRQVAVTIRDDDALRGSGDVLRAVSSLLAPVPVEAPKPLTEEEINAMVADMRARIFVYSQPRSRWNQLQQELRKIQGHPDEGMLLRALYHALPEEGLARYVRPAIQDLRDLKLEE